MTAEEVVAELKTLGSESIKKVLVKHGAREPFFGVKIEHLKKIQKRIKTDYELALDLYDTGISDAMYLAGLITDDSRMTKADLRKWMKQAPWHMISECTVAWVAAESKHGHALGLEWIESKQEATAAAGWTTLGCLVSIKPDEELDLDELRQLLDRVARTIHQQPNRVRLCMNQFVICVGGYVKPLTGAALKAGEKIGEVSVDMGETACQVPDIAAYIKKMEDRGSIGKKRKTVKC